MPIITAALGRLHWLNKAGNASSGALRACFQRVATSFLLVILSPILSFATMPALLSPSLVDAVVKQDHEPLAMKRCSRCKKVLPLALFGKASQYKDGLRYECKSCHTAEVTQSQQKNPITVQTGRMNNDARKRAKKKNVPFDIDAGYLRSIAPSHCPILGMPLEWSTHRGLGRQSLPNSPSLDRIDPTKGYVKGNVWIISNKANTIKSNATHEELKLVAEAVGRAIVDSLDW